VFVAEPDARIKIKLKKWLLFALEMKQHVEIYSLRGGVGD
jgi:hypothetical protein